MATHSASPPSSTGDNPQTTVTTATEEVPPMASGNTATTKETSVFVNAQPIREEQVQNAIKFLSHPKVKGSPIMYRRSFLERKGLTKEEIDEAFRLVPDESPSLPTTQPAVSNQVGKPQPLPTQSLQAIAASPVGPISKLGTSTASRFRWSHVLLAVGILAVSGAGTAVVFKNSVVPRLKSWIRKIVLEEEEDLTRKSNAKPTLAEEAAAAAKAAAAAAADIVRANQEIMISKTEERRYFGELVSLLDMQVQEMKLMSNSIKKLEGQNNISWQEGNRVQVASSRQSYANVKTDHNSHSVRSLSPPQASVEPPTAPPHPKSFAEIMAMVQRGERPPNIREINDQPPNPDQPVTNPRLAPRPKPWEAAQSQVASTYPLENNGLNSYGSGSGSVHQSNGDGSVPWWQQKNVQITEAEPNDWHRTGFPGGSSERPVQRSSWVPPQPPPVAMAEAAAAIRQPKKLPVVKEQQLSTEVTDELQRITKVSESGGVSDIDGRMNASETRREEDGSYAQA